MNWFKRIFGKPEFTGDCVPRALYQGTAWVYQKKLPVRFIVQNIKPGIDHIQCQVFYDDKWEWSSQWDDYVTIGNQEFKDAPIIKILTLEQLFQERIDAEKAKNIGNK